MSNPTQQWQQWQQVQQQQVQQQQVQQQQVQRQQVQQQQVQQQQVHPQPYLRPLEQEPYNAPSHTTTIPALDQAPIRFIDTRTQRGIRARDMLNGAFLYLSHAEEPLPIPDEIKSKVTVRVHPRGYRPFSKPKYIRDTEGRPITYSKMAQRVAEVLNEYLELPETRETMPPPGCVRLGPGGIGFEHIFIETLYHKSRGSFQPEIAIYVS
ncbi:uncharacterized protein PHACADRAFT_256648 [Phanerochaete carnosa HHB-10118-sp]|uniref:Uncharacterized protein n=1 Tax=Phanerochaete carnosa (strain HHB-10118-sp) TaxID=650164 RepID=K5W992_PHACS|nr:uncharacterized protein PHACADRAFT_256648 [Phanerochaete carnosa HHB-10118-sp]EKM55780.1 hypothetical protein PHACADRAFT_256648 [Phanerochaete carnosa HHB-10118-sp]